MVPMKKPYVPPQFVSAIDLKPLTREEVTSWPPLGPMNIDPARVLKLIIERDAAVSRYQKEVQRYADCCVVVKDLQRADHFERNAWRKTYSGVDKALLEMKKFYESDLSEAQQTDLRDIIAALETAYVGAPKKPWKPPEGAHS